MRRSVAALPLLFAAATAAQVPPGPLWSGRGDAIDVAPCPRGGDHEAGCRSIVARAGRSETLLGSGYIVARLLWRRPPGGAGPDALVSGDGGGSGGDGDLFAVTFAPRLAVAKLSGERMDMAAVHPGPGALRLDLPFDLEYFNGAPHAGAVIARLPVRWTNRGWSLDRGALLARRWSADGLAFRALAIREELRRWAQDRYPALTLYPPEAKEGTPVTTQALLDLILADRPAAARILLHHAWPSGWDRLDVKLGGEDAFWARLCGAVTRQPLWARFRLDRLPHAALIVAAARRAV